MGTRCDFYVGRGDKAEWLGSYPLDGYPDGIERAILSAATEDTYRGAVARKVGGERGTLPAMGWPWPWANSHLTDYAYAFDGGKVWASRYGSEWFDPFNEPKDDLPKTAVFPDMRDRQNVTFGPRSGCIVLSRQG